MIGGIELDPIKVQRNSNASTFQAADLYRIWFSLSAVMGTPPRDFDVPGNSTHGKIGES